MIDNNPMLYELAHDLLYYVWSKYHKGESVSYMESGVILYLPEAQDDFDKIVDIIETTLNL